MSEFEYIDLFPENPPVEKTTYRPETQTERHRMPLMDRKSAVKEEIHYNFEDPDYGDAEINSGERLHYTDFKRGMNSYQQTPVQTQSVSTPVVETPAKPKASGKTVEPKEKSERFISLNDEKIVWAGAIFVFFGVFAFLIGYWLGKSTSVSINTENEARVSQYQNQMAQKSTENSYMNGQTTQPSADKPVPLAPVSTTKTTVPVNASLPNSGTVPMNTTMPNNTGTPNTITKSTGTITAPPVTLPQEKPVGKPKAEIKTETKTATPVTTTKPIATTAKTGGENIAIQVSAYTQLDKAQTVESEMRAAGYNSYIVESIINGVRYYRVRVGTFATKDEANSALSKIRQMPSGKNSMILSLK